MKNHRLSAFASLLLTASAVSVGYAIPAAPGNGAQDIAQRVDQLEERLVTLEKENQELTRRADETATFLGRQASAAKTFVAALAQSESLGFSRGINFESREVLVAGLRAAYAAQQKDVPKPAAKGAVKATARR